MVCENYEISKSVSINKVLLESIHTIHLPMIPDVSPAALAELAVVTGAICPIKNTVIPPWLFTEKFADPWCGGRLGIEILERQKEQRLLC